MAVIILDLDGCISDDEWRRDFIDWAASGHDRYAKYHARCADDPIGNEHLFRGLPHRIVIFTARPEWCRAQTVAWLDKHNVQASAVFMRADGDVRPSRIIKADMVRRLMDSWSLTAEDVHVAYDDRAEVVVMYRRLGIRSECRAIRGIYAED